MTSGTSTGALDVDAELAPDVEVRAVAEAENKLAVIKKWNFEIEDRTAPFTRQIDQLQGFLAQDMSRAVAFLDQVLAALAAYREVAPPGAARNPPTPGTGENRS